jgi:hypothetical protein
VKVTLKSSIVVNPVCSNHIYLFEKVEILQQAQMTRSIEALVECALKSSALFVTLFHYLFNDFDISCHSLSFSFLLVFL